MGARVGLLVLAVVLLSPIETAAAAVLRVAPDGSGDHATIAAAIDAAAPGATILIAPGRYTENLVVHKSLTLRGEGERDEVVIAPGAALPERRDVPDDDDPVVTHVFIEGADTTIENLSLVADERIGTSLLLRGGEHHVRDIVSSHIIGIDGEVEATIDGSDLGRVVVMGAGATAIIRDSSLSDAMHVGMGATAIVEDSRILDWPIDVFDDATLEARGNTFRPVEGAPAIWVNWAGGSATVIDNRIEGAWQGVMVEHGAFAHIEGNTIVDPGYGIHVVETGGVVRDNVITGASEVGIAISGNGTTVEDNIVEGGRIGIAISMPNGYPPGAPRWDEPSTFTGNVVAGASHYGIHVNDASPVISDNSICAGREPLKLQNEAAPWLGTNDICEVAE